MLEKLTRRNPNQATTEHQKLQAFDQNVRRANIAAATAEHEYSSKTKNHRFIGNVAINLDISHGEVVANSANKKASGKTSRVRAVVNEQGEPVLVAKLDRPGQEPLQRKFKGPIALGGANAIAERVIEGANLSGQKRQQRIEASRHKQEARRAGRLSYKQAAEAPARRLHAVA